MTLKWKAVTSVRFESTPPNLRIQSKRKYRKEEVSTHQ